MNPEQLLGPMLFSGLGGRAGKKLKKKKQKSMGGFGGTGEGSVFGGLGNLLDGDGL